jgi:DNA processing protein
MSACDRCLRRAALLAALSGHIEYALEDRRRLPQLLALPDGELIHAVCGDDRGSADATLRRFDSDLARREAQAARLETVCPHGSRYPPLLRQESDAPAALYFDGVRDVFDALAKERPVAVVGSRKASGYGLEVARTLGRELAATGVPVVSGMAFGVDSAAHEGALAAGGPTVAVMPSGADVSYPRTLHGLHRRIRTEGLVLSEMPPGTKPRRWSFPARNRIMAALSRITIVVEGTSKSGSLITARFAQDLGRDVGAVPGQITSTLATGPNDLLADGACVVRSAADVLDVLYGPGARAVPPDRLAPRGRAREPPLAPRLARLLKAVEKGATVDGLARAGEDVGDLLAGLTELELLGLVRRGPGGAYLRRA